LQLQTAVAGIGPKLDSSAGCAWWADRSEGLNRAWLEQ
jgi:hypothetical protein